MSTSFKSMILGAGMAACLLPATAFAQDSLEAGKKVFTQTAAPACAVCHTLKHAGSTGEIGPSLDELKPDASRVEKAVRNWIGQMAAFAALSADDIKAVSQYVAAVAGK